MKHRRPVSNGALAERLDHLVATFDVSTIEPDPLQLVLRYDDQRDIEVAGLIAAAFAYGRAEIVVKNAGSVLDRMLPSPSAYLDSFSRADALQTFRGFSHRFQKRPELIALLERMAAVQKQYGSLGQLFRSVYDERAADIGPALTSFVEAIIESIPPDANQRRALGYLLSSPEAGSACKRMNLFLRWMVRRESPDLGVWDFVDPAKLVMPVDTHIHRIATFLGLNDRRSADWKAARAITDRLALFNPADPVRYDFAICRLGILDLCSTRRKKENCDVCMLRDVCRFPVA